MPSYRDELEAWAKSVGSDGCSWPATQVHQVCCWGHDYAYFSGKTPRGVPVTKAEADQLFRDCLQRHSSFRWLSPMSWWRWLAVSWFGQGVWTETDERPVAALYGSAVAFVEAERARTRILKELRG